LSQYNVLILDEPGNHLDVDTVEALADALIDYQGTVIFTSHDRHFMKRVATCIVEVRDGHVTNYRGDYEAYLYSVNKEIEEGERELATRLSKAPPGKGKPSKAPPKPPRRSEREIRKEMTNIERAISRTDEQKKVVNEQLLQTTDPEEALRLHNEVTALAGQIAEAEERWLQLQAELDEAS
jgi:ATP-binding cassette subfamily F protein 3